MTETWYCGFKWGKIEEVQVIKHSDKFVTLANGRRQGRDSDWRWIAPIRKEVEEKIVAHMQMRIESAKYNLVFAQKELNDFLATVKP